MIATCKWQGGLGNNLFQIAMVYAYCHKYNLNPQFDRGAAAFDYFNLPERTEPIKNYFAELSQLNELLEIPFIENVCFQGYFQHHEYFDAIKNKFNRIFKVPLNWQPYTIAVHIRRGDFLKYPDDFPTQPVSYYMDCLEKLNYTTRKVVICTNQNPSDIAYCKHYFPFATVRTGTSELNDLYFMANCEAVVMSNSTFSFWAAYLNRCNATVYYPLNWFNKNSGRTGAEICLKKWIGYGI